MRLELGGRLLSHPSTRKRSRRPMGWSGVCRNPSHAGMPPLPTRQCDRSGPLVPRHAGAGTLPSRSRFAPEDPRGMTRERWLPGMLVLLGAVLLYLPGLGATDLWAPDEP